VKGIQKASRLFGLEAAVSGIFKSPEFAFISPYVDHLFAQAKMKAFVFCRFSINIVMLVFKKLNILSNRPKGLTHGL
jgi:hypothetical protein|tara:strand:- start:1313 stop:1543 length:231 start_codon:yes stop_codon:yes gene_type:complete